MFLRIFLAVVLALLPGLSLAGPITREEGQRQTRVLEQLKKSLAAAEEDADKFAILGGVLSAEKNPNFRRKILAIAVEIKDPAQEDFYIAVLTNDEDAGIRSLAATTLGKTGSEKSLAALAKTAASDRTTMMTLGDISAPSSARRSATFAIAELAGRHPHLADKVAAELRALPDKFDPKDNESLYDARLQALFQISRDDSLLKPFFDRMKDSNPKVRMDGTNALQFLKFKQAPPELLEALEDEDAGVRSNAALVLGRIGDPKTAPALIAISADRKADRGVRVNAITSLGQMRAPDAADMMRKLLDDPAVSTNAAIALYRITGKKVAQFPEGYQAD